MPLMHCPHCGAQNFTIESWADLDHCTTCGKPLGERDPRDRGGAARGGSASVSRPGSPGSSAKKPRPA